MHTCQLSVLTIKASVSKTALIKMRGIVFVYMYVKCSFRNIGKGSND